MTTRSRAFTLIETLVSLSLLGLILVLVMNLFPSSLATVRRSEQRFRAETLADSILEQQAAAPESQSPIGTNLNLAPQTIDQVVYRPHLTATAVTGENPTYLRSLQVTVTWVYGGQTLTTMRELRLHHMAIDQ